MQSSNDESQIKRLAAELEDLISLGRGDPDRVVAFLNQHSDNIAEILAYKLENGDTPLMLACNNNDPRLAEAILAHLKNFNAPQDVVAQFCKKANTANQTAFTIACEKNNSVALKIIALAKPEDLTTQLFNSKAALRAFLDWAFDHYIDVVYPIKEKAPELYQELFETENQTTLQDEDAGLEPVPLRRPAEPPARPQSETLGASTPSTQRPISPSASPSRVSAANQPKDYPFLQAKKAPDKIPKDAKDSFVSMMRYGRKLRNQLYYLAANSEEAKMLEKKLDALEKFVAVVKSEDATPDSIREAAKTFNKADENRGYNLYSIVTALKGKKYDDKDDGAIISTMGERVYDFYKAYENAVEHEQEHSDRNLPRM